MFPIALIHDCGYTNDFRYLYLAIKPKDLLTSGIDIVGSKNAYAIGQNAYGANTSFKW